LIFLNFVFLISGGTFEQIALLQRLFVGVMAPLCALLEDTSSKEDSKTISVLLDGLANILAAAETMGDLENVSLHAEECYVLDRIELLHNLHDDDKISDKALAILEKYFPFDVEARRRTCTSHIHGEETDVKYSFL
jgi:importin subunit alpha-2